jgi:hypothetical protein
VVVAEVDDAVGGGGRAAAQAVEVVQIAAQNLGAQARDRCGRGIGPGETDNLLPGFEKLADDRRTVQPDAPVTNTPGGPGSAANRRRTRSSPALRDSEGTHATPSPAIPASTTSPAACA